MKTQISANHLNNVRVASDEELEKNPDAVVPPYTGVYLQQGRMLLDADWNEQVDLTKESQRLQMNDSIGSGIPREGGIDFDGLFGLTEYTAHRERTLEVETEKAVATKHSGFPKVGKGIFYVDGKRVQLEQDVELFSGIPMPRSSNVVAYLDVYEREVTAIEDPSISDPALYGADTCSRTKTVVQLRWLTSSDFKRLESTGKSTCIFRSANEMGQGDVEPMLVRAEIHEANYNDGYVVVKWSLENAAEQYNVSTVTEEFKQGNYVYEFFSSETEDCFGLQRPGYTQTRPKLIEREYPKSGSGPFVRRWDGYAKIDFATFSSGSSATNQRALPLLKNGKLDHFYDRNVTLSEGLGAQTAGHISFNAAEYELSVNLGMLSFEMKLDPDALMVGDFWQARVRNDGKSPQQSETVNGYRHHYLRLNRNTPVFPALTSITADDVRYSHGESSVEDALGDLENQTALLASDVENLQEEDRVQKELIAANTAEIKRVEEMSHNAERLALFGRGVVAGFVPLRPSVTLNSKVHNGFEMKIGFNQPAGTLIDGKGALWMNAEVEETLFTCQGVYRFYSEAEIKKRLGAKHKARFKKNPEELTLYSAHPFVVLEVMKACLGIDVSLFQKRAKPFDVSEFIYKDNTGEVNTPLYVYPKDEKLHAFGALVSDSAEGDNVLDAFAVTQRILSKKDSVDILDDRRKKNVVSLQKEIDSALEMVVNDQSKESVFRSKKWSTTGRVRKDVFANAWADFSAYPNTIEENAGQVCVGSIVCMDNNASIVPSGREQVLTSPWMQLKGITEEAEPSSPTSPTDSDDSASRAGYNLIIKDLGKEAAHVFVAMQETMAMSRRQVLQFFVEKELPVVLKENLVLAVAEKYQVALVRAGASVELKRSESATGKQAGQRMRIEASDENRKDVINKTHEITGISKEKIALSLDNPNVELIRNIQNVDAAKYKKVLEGIGAKVILKK